MSDTQPEPSSSVPELDEDQVAAWLVAHPDFVARHPEAFEAQAIGHDAQGATSLIERQVARLRQTNRELAARFEERGHRFSELLVELIRHDSFRYVSQQTEEGE